VRLQRPSPASPKAAVPSCSSDSPTPTWTPTSGSRPSTGDPRATSCTSPVDRIGGLSPLNAGPMG